MSLRRQHVGNGKGKGKVSPVQQMMPLVRQWGHPASRCVIQQAISVGRMVTRASRGHTTPGGTRGKRKTTTVISAISSGSRDAGGESRVAPSLSLSTCCRNRFPPQGDGDDDDPMPQFQAPAGTDSPPVPCSIRSFSATSCPSAARSAR